MRTTRTEMRDDHRQVLASLEAYREEVSKREAEKIKQANIDAALKNVPARFAGKNFYDFKVKCAASADVKRIIQKYAETFSDRLSEGASLIFSGRIGTGKTMLAYSLYQYLIKIGFRAEYQPSIHFLRLLHDKEFESYYAFERQLAFYKELPFLIIDEATEGCGKGAYPSDWERNLFRVLIDARYQANLPSLIITNRNKNELIERLGEPTINRLSENGIFLAFTWKSYR